MVSPLLTASSDEEGAGISWVARREAAVQHYERLGWRVVTDENRVLVLCDNSISAVEVDRALGGEVHNFLATHLLAGPVIELPGTPTRWLFLAAGVEEMSPATHVRIRARRGIVHVAGTLIPMPPSRMASGEVVWKQPVMGGAPELPQFHSVAGALRAVTEGPGIS
jgi:hypothetical protein